MPARQGTIVSSVNWAVFCKPLCAESQRKGIQRRLSEATEEEGVTVVEQDRVRTLIRLSKARKYDATKELLQRMLAQFPGTGGQEALAPAFSVSGSAQGCPKQCHRGSTDRPSIVPAGAGVGLEIRFAFQWRSAFSVPVHSERGTPWKRGVTAPFGQPLVLSR